ncbi:ketopantoate reductase [Curtobacterium sp. PhB130]|uniref:oxidoreductase n=1 Tax=Curtobacterium sp. PhB130 TaxID=2485178 RepID=UPI000F4CE12F|nr:oxidoreductase [Curtobacterium sp. PhB130]ROS73131.1 ketopantoate reductase [Curtobacterium sp. PhB130]
MNRSVAVVGPGAIGTTVAAALHEVGRTPALYGRRARADVTLLVDDRRIVVPGPVVGVGPAPAVSVPAPAVSVPAPAVSVAAPAVSVPARPVDVVFLAVKATQVAAAAGWLDALCGPDTVVCVLQNGVEQVAAVTPYAGSAQVVPAVVWFPAVGEPDGAVRLLAPARLTLPDTPAAAVVRDVLDGSRCSVELAADFTSVAWRKLVQNAVAGLMALTGRRAGVFGRPDVAELALAYARECVVVGRAVGADLGDDVAPAVVAGFVDAPADSGTSILADRDAGHPLEWDVRNGVVRRLGRAHGIPTPISDVVVPLLAAVSDGPG